MCCGRNCPAWLLVGLLATLSCAVARAEPPEQLDRLIQQLDADSFEAREDAARALRAIGKPALAALEKARGHKSLEVRWRAKAIADSMTVGVRLREFTAFASLPDDKLDLEQGMWLISRILDPEVKKHDLTTQLDQLADQVRKKLGKGIDPPSADPQVVVAAVRQVLHGDQGFTGNVDDYNNPDNSSLARVLETEEGAANPAVARDGRRRPPAESADRRRSRRRPVHHQVRRQRSPTPASRRTTSTSTPSRTSKSSRPQPPPALPSRSTPPAKPSPACSATCSPTSKAAANRTSYSRCRSCLSCWRRMGPSRATSIARKFLAPAELARWSHDSALTGGPSPEFAHPRNPACCISRSVA